MTTVTTTAERLQLHLSSTDAIGYKGVVLHRSRRYGAQSGGRSLGISDTAVETAVCYAQRAAEELAAAVPQANLGAASVVGPPGPSATSAAPPSVRLVGQCVLSQEKGPRVRVYTPARIYIW